MPATKKSAVVILALAVAGVLAFAVPSRAGPSACAKPELRVFKNEAVLELACDGAIALEVPATFGANPVGHKERQGDERTPEGEYRVTSKTKSERFHRFLALSYPSEADLARARAAGISDPGDAIGIHGSRPRVAALARVWLRLSRITGLAARWGPTDGCIAVTNEDAETLYALVPVGTKVTIRPTRDSALH